MRFEQYEILSITAETEFAFSLTLSPKNKKRNIKFSPGQFYHIKNPTYKNTNETRQFSITSSPKTKDHVSFLIKIYGEWTKQLFTKKKGDTLWLFGPMGIFTFEKKTTHAVFLAGGVGIAPILSMLTHVSESKKSPNITLLYANHEKKAILKEKELRAIFQKNTHWKPIFLVSQGEGVTKDYYVGRITKNLLQKEVSNSKNHIYFICGSATFLKNIRELLEECGVFQNQIKQEIFLPAYPEKS